MTVRGQLIALLLSVSLAFSLFTSIYYPRQQHRIAIDGLTSKLESVERLAADLLAPAIAFDDWQGIDNTVDSLLRLDSAAFAIVADPQGAPLLARAAAGYDPYLQAHLADPSGYNDPDLVIDTVPIEGLGSSIGLLTVAFHSEAVRSAVNASRKASFLAGVLILALGLLGGTFIALRLIRPLPTITNAFISLSNGQFEHQVPETGASEFVRLSQAFNRTRETLRKLFTEMSRTNEALAAEIAVRRRAESAITESLREKEVLLKEIHHRVKNNLQVVSSLLSLQAQRIADPDIREFFTDSQNRVRSMALIHEKLYQSRGLASIDFSEYIHNLLAHLSRTYGVDADRVTMITQIADTALNLDTAIPCGLIVSELVSNAFKHAFPDRRCGTVQVSLTADGEALSLAVCDDGVGLPEHFNINRSRSLGLQLVTTLVDQLGGTLDIKSPPGVSFRMHFEQVRYKERVNV